MLGCVCRSPGDAVLAETDSDDLIRAPGLGVHQVVSTCRSAAVGSLTMGKARG